MSLNETLLEVIACPACHGALREVIAGTPADGTELACADCGLAYPVQDGIPVLLVDRARQG